jgi:hypothetical protein
MVVVPEPPPLSHRVALAGNLDLDHIGAKVAEQRADVRTRQELAELQYPQAGQRRFATGVGIRLRLTRHVRLRRRHA